jgi:hypothetical protein
MLVFGRECQAMLFYQAISYQAEDRSEVGPYRIAFIAAALVAVATLVFGAVGY